MKRILVVDDDESIRALEERILKREGYEVVTAPDGFTAMSLYKNQNFDLVLLDIMMPGMDGFKVGQTIRQVDKEKPVPVIFISAKTDGASMKEGFQSGGKVYLTKPFTAQQLLQVVRAMIR